MSKVSFFSRLFWAAEFPPFPSLLELELGEIQITEQNQPLSATFFGETFHQIRDQQKLLSGSRPPLNNQNC